MMTRKRTPEEILSSCRADLDRAEASIRRERATVQRLASNDLHKVSPDYQILVLLARLQMKRWEVADLEIEHLYRTKPDPAPVPAVSAPRSRLGWRERVGAVKVLLSVLVRGRLD